MLTIHNTDALTALRQMEAESAQCCVTSPPYWSLRDYGIAPMVWNGAESCEHVWGDKIAVNATNHTDKRRWNHTRNGRDEEQPAEKRVGWLRTLVDQGNVCEACGAWRGCLGLEPTPELYVQHVVEVFREAWRVLKSDGTLWCNLGDSYNAAGRDGHGTRQGFKQGTNRASANGSDKARPTAPDLKPKDLIGIPWMVAFALRADGWYLRSDIIWAKPNPMPESVTDRPTKSHEYIFLLSKSQQYFYDHEAIKEPAQLWTGQAATFERTGPVSEHVLPGQSAAQHRPNRTQKPEGPNSRINRSRDVAHAHEYEGKNRAADDQWSGRRMLKNAKEARDNGGSHDAPFGALRNKRSVWTIATAPFSDAHFATFPTALVTPCILAGSRSGDVVLDPFAGSGTVGKVAIELGRRAVLIEPNPEYVKMIERRTTTTIGLPL